MHQKHHPRLLPESHRITPASIKHPADVKYGRRWQIATLCASWWGIRSLRRRQWRQVLASGGIGAAVLWYARFHEPARPVLRHITITDARIPAQFDGLRIGQISDMHLGQRYSDANTQWAIDALTKHAPDVIVITGDLVNERPAIGRLVYLLRQLRAPLGVYAIPGNHDYVEHIDDVAQAIQLAGIPLLRNQGVRLTRHGATMWLAGVDDMWHGSMQIDTAMANADGLPTILLAHSPDSVLEAQQYANIVLQLSGHVHGGHIYVKGLGLLARPRFGMHYTRGTYHVGSTWLHVSVGLSGRALRLGNPPEVGIITLRHTIHNKGNAHAQHQTTD